MTIIWFRQQGSYLQMDVKEYLVRIGLADGVSAPDHRTLKILQRSHLHSVPFENLDIHWKRPISLDLEKFYKKIVAGKRGGFCYELNGLFDQLLRAIGFETRLVSARVFNGKDHGPEFEHAAIIVKIGDDEYLADVGFGAFATNPLRISLDDEQSDQSGTFLIRKREDGYFEVLKREEGVWRSEYIFRDTARALVEFLEMCDFQQYSPDSHFTKGKLCSIMTKSGRKTLTDKTFVITTNAGKKENPVNSETEFFDLLAREFSIVRAESA